MRKLLFSSLFLIVIIMGCSNDEAYNNAIQKGLDYIASEEYQKAESAFELALDEKKGDVRATALLEQTENYQQAELALEEAELEVATENAEKVVNETEGSSALSKKAEDILSSVESLQTTLTELTDKHKKAVKHFEDKEYKETNKIVKALLVDDLDHPLFKSLIEDIKKLQKDASAAIKKEKEAKEKVTAEKERKEKEATERAAAEKAKKEADANVFTPEKALAMAKAEYGEGDTGYSVNTEKLQSEIMSYYIVQLYSKSMREDGGSGNLFSVEVYEDGSIYEAW